MNRKWYRKLFFHEIFPEFSIWPLQGDFKEFFPSLKWYKGKYMIRTMTSPQFLKEGTLHAFQSFSLQVIKPLAQNQCDSLWFPSGIKRRNSCWHMKVVRANPSLEACGNWKTFHICLWQSLLLLERKKRKRKFCHDMH